MHKSEHVLNRQLDALYKLNTHVTNIQIKDSPCATSEAFSSPPALSKYNCPPDS